MMKIPVFIAALVSLTEFYHVAAFTGPTPHSIIVSNRMGNLQLLKSKTFHLNKLELASSDEQENETLDEVLPESEKEVAVTPQEEENSVPLDVPSPILLASSIILAIATTGKYSRVFFLSYFWNSLCNKLTFFIDFFFN